MKPKKSNYYAESSDFEDKNIPGEVQYRRRKYLTLFEMWITAVTIVILVFALIAGTRSESNSNTFKSINGIYINGEDAYIRFNMSDQNQLQMLNQIQAYCQFKGIDRCGRFEK